MSAANSGKASACGPSLRAFSGSGWISTIRPCGPTARAASASGTGSLETISKRLRLRKISSPTIASRAQDNSRQTALMLAAVVFSAGRMP